MTEYYKDKIGYLPYKGSLQFSNGGIYPLENFRVIQEYVNKKLNKDGYFYPPTVETYSQGFKVVNGKLEVFEELIPNTKRHAQMFKMPASHELRIINPSNKDDPRNTDGLFITYLIAFIFGIRMQFHDWFFDGRVPVTRHQDFIFIHDATERFIDKAYDTWLTCTKENQLLLTNLLYMQTKVKSYEWHWERFLISYMVIDGCYKYLKETQSVTSEKHKDRIKAIIDFFDIKFNTEWIDRIVGLRNEIIHEALWEGAQPGNSGSTYSYSAGFHLSKLNNRIIFALLGHRGQYIQSPWWHGDMFMF